MAEVNCLVIQVKAVVERSFFAAIAGEPQRPALGRAVRTVACSRMRDCRRTARQQARTSQLVQVARYARKRNRVRKSRARPRTGGSNIG